LLEEAVVQENTQEAAEQEDIELEQYLLDQQIIQLQLEWEALEGHLDLMEEILHLME
jgi:hypothetical protein